MAAIHFTVPVALVLIQALLASPAAADLRLASTPKNSFKVQNQGGAVAFATTTALYMEPSTFNYNGLNNQKNNNYDNFLRSNIDNEQDNRNFQNEAGKDMLPFRTLEAASTGTAITVAPGVQQTVPLRWNNPHSSELEVNVWVAGNTVVIPVKKPVCAGEGHQDGVVTYTIPADFNTKVQATVPGFAGCQKVGDCTLQIYAHSVEPRTYSIGTPIIISGYNANAPKATDGSLIGPATSDPGTDLSKLPNALCLPANDPSADIQSATPRKARLVSDVFNHAYQSSDYSPYSGQQQESISKNLQASAVLRMTSGNRGELGKAALDQSTKDFINQLNGKVNNIINRYEQAANNIIKNVVNNVKTTGKIGNQNLANGFRVLEAGATNANRQETATYIPSFVIPGDKVQQASNTLAGNLKGLVSNNLAQIYVAALNELKPDFDKAAARGVKYQPAMIKSTVGTMADVTNFRKVDANGKADNGKYAATAAFKAAGVKFLSALEVDGDTSIDSNVNLPDPGGNALAANPDDAPQDVPSDSVPTDTTSAASSVMVSSSSVAALLLSAVAFL